MKKIILSLFCIALLSVAIIPVLAEESTTPDSNRGQSNREREARIAEMRREKDSTKTGELENQRNKNIERVRVSIKARAEAYNNIIKRSEILLDKLQQRINAAKAAGKDIKSAEIAMTEARANLKDANTKMDEVRSLVGTSMNKQEFKDVQQKLQSIHKDLNMIKQNAARIIRVIVMREYYSSTPSAIKK